MSFRVTFLTDAERDLHDIEEYLSHFYASTARNFFEQLKKKILLLENMPDMCPTYENDSYFRRMAVDDYLLFYSVDERQKLVVVHRMFHSKRDASQQIMTHRTLE